MSTLLDTLMDQLGGDQLEQMSGRLGTDRQTTRNAVGAALPTLLGALARNASRPEGAQALHGALDRDHDGSVLENLSGFLSQAESGPGKDILRHVLGNRQPAVEAGIGRTSGMRGESAGQLLAMLAPLVMGALGQEQRRRGLDASALAGYLGEERVQVERRAPKEVSLLAGLLDTDADGDVDAGDITRHATGLLGKLFGKR